MSEELEQKLICILVVSTFSTRMAKNLVVEFNVIDLLEKK